MKKIALLIAAVALGAAAHAQVVVGLQGGYRTHSTNNPSILAVFGDELHGNLTKDTVSLSSTETSIVGGLQVGYQITPKLYAGIQAGIISQSGDTALSRDYIFLPEAAHSFYHDQWMTIGEHKFKHQRSGWTVAPQVKYEFARYGNMHFNLMLQAEVCSMGYSTLTESYYKPFDNNEFIEMDPYEDSVKSFTLGVSLRPTLVYEFSTHLSAELSLDFLSIGYVSHRESHDGTEAYYDPEDYTRQHPHALPPHEVSASTFYAGLNTFMQSLAWESPLLRLGFNWKF